MKIAHFLIILLISVVTWANEPSDKTCAALLTSPTGTALSRLMEAAYKKGLLTSEELREWMAQDSAQVPRYKSAPTSENGALRRAIEKQVNLESREQWEQTRASIRILVASLQQQIQQQEQVKVQTAMIFAPQEIELPADLVANKAKHMADAGSLGVQRGAYIQFSPTGELFLNYFKGSSIQQIPGALKAMRLDTKNDRWVLEKSLDIPPRWQSTWLWRMLPNNSFQTLERKMDRTIEVSDVGSFEFRSIHPPLWLGGWVVGDDYLSARGDFLRVLDTTTGQVEEFPGKASLKVITSRNEPFVVVNKPSKIAVLNLTSKSEVFTLPDGHKPVNLTQSESGDAVLIYEEISSREFRFTIRNLHTGSEKIVKFPGAYRSVRYCPPQISFNKNGGYRFAVLKLDERDPHIVVYDENGKEIWKSAPVDSVTQFRFFRDSHENAFLIAYNERHLSNPVRFFNVGGNGSPIFSKTFDQFDNLRLAQSVDQVYLLVDNWESFHLYRMFQEVE